MRTWAKIAIGALCLLVSVVILAVTYRHLSGKSYSGVVEGLSYRASYVVCDGVRYRHDEFGELYIWPDSDDEYVYKRFSKRDTGSTAHRVFEFYDIHHNLLYKIEDLGNRDLIQVSLRGSDSDVTVYQVSAK